MVARTPRLKHLARQFVRHLMRKIRVEQVILFGSRAYGQPRRGSDIDIAVVSPGFARMNDIKRIMFLTDIARKLPTPRFTEVDVLGFTPKEIRTADYFDIAGEIRDRGKILYQRQ